MRVGSFPGPVGRLLHAALDRLSLHHISYQATRRGYQLADDEFDEEVCSVDSELLEEAAARFRRGDTPEALIWLERALPDTFSGLADRVIARDARWP